MQSERRVHFAGGCGWSERHANTTDMTKVTCALCLSQCEADRGDRNFRGLGIIVCAICEEPLAEHEKTEWHIALGEVA